MTLALCGSGALLALAALATVLGLRLCRARISTQLLEARLAVAESQLHALLESIPDLAWLKDREGRFLAVNQPFAEACGVAARRLVGKTDLDAWPQDLAERYRAGDLEVIETARTSRVEEPYQSVLGEERTWIRTTKVPVHDQNGRVVGTAATARDVTARRAAERELTSSRDFFYTLLSSVPNPVLVMDGKARCAHLNNAAASFFGLPPTVALGKTPQALLGPKLADAVLAIHADVLARAHDVERVVEFEELDGARRCASIRARRHVDPAGRELVIAVGTDLTQQRLAEDALRHSNRQLEAANRELESFAYSVSHDLRGPLHAIAGFSRALAEDCRDRLDPSCMGLLDRIQRCVARMGTQIDAILSLSRASRAEMQRAPVSLSVLAEHVVQRLRESDPARQSEVVIAPALDVEGDLALLRSCLENLLGNAWKFTSGRAAARIELGEEVLRAESGAEPVGERVFFVRDNGVGFNMRYASRLFGAFQRLHRAEEFPGTGVGLALVQRIIHRHGGRVWAQSEVGQGTTVYFTLRPAARDRSRDGSETPAAEVSEQARLVE